MEKIKHPAGAAAAAGPVTGPRRRIGALVRLPTWLLWPAVLVIAAFVLAPQLGIATQLKWVLWLSYGIAAISLALVWGQAGIFSLGQSVLFGIGAYAYAVTALNVGVTSGETVSSLLIAVAAGGVLAAVLGYIMFFGRISDVYLAIFTLAVTLIVYTVMASTAGPEYRIGDARLGGFNGMPGLPTISLGIPGLAAGAPLSPGDLLVFAVVSSVCVYCLARWLMSSRFGQIIRGIRENETRMELLGYDARLYKLAIYVVGGCIAGFAGGLFASWGTFINPEVFSLTQAAMIVVWVMVGGRESLAGAFVGAVLVQWIADQADAMIPGQTPLILGTMLILVVLCLPRGVVPALQALVAKVFSLNRGGAPAAPVPPPGPELASATSAPEPRVAGTALEAQAVSKNFGGLTVLSDVSLRFTGPGIHAVIGANGAGKSTFFGCLSGRHPVSSGSILLDNRDITALPTYRRARLGLGIKLQVPSIFPALTVRENLELCCRTTDAAARLQEIDSLFRGLGIAWRWEVRAETLSHGEKQWLEIAMVVAQNPAIIMLDEPAAGMTKDERQQTVRLIRELGDRHTVIVVEHDMQFIKALDAPVAMLHQGRNFRAGTFNEVSADPEVMDVYLGRRHAARS